MPRLSLGLGVGGSGLIAPAAPSEFGLPSSITIAGAVGSSISVNGTYSKTNQAIGYLAESTNGSFNYYNFTGPNLYITSPLNTNSNGDYNYAGWVIASSADGAYYFMTNPSTDKFNFPTTGWVYSDVFGGSNIWGQSGSASLTITVPTFPNVATTNVVNALINTSDAETTSYLQSVGFAAVGGVFSVPLTKQVPPSQNYLSVEYKTTFNDGATCYLVHSTAANNTWYFSMQQVSYHEEFGSEYYPLINIFTTEGQSNATIPAARSSWLGTKINSMVSPNCFS